MFVNEIEQKVRERITRATEDDDVRMYANQLVDSACDLDIDSIDLPIYNTRINAFVRRVIALATTKRDIDRYVESVTGQACDYVEPIEGRDNAWLCMLVDDQREVVVLTHTTYSLESIAPSN